MIRREDFVLKSKADPSIPHEVIFAIKQRNLDVLEAEVLERATPGNAKYLKWMTFEEVGALVSNPESAQAAIDWLSSHGIEVSWIALRKEYMKATAPISVWEKLFDTTFYSWADEHPHSINKTISHIRAIHYSLPEEMHAHVDAVFNTVQAPPVINKKYHRLDADAPTKSVFRPNLRYVREALDVASKEAGASGTVTTVAYLNAFYGITSNIGQSSLNQSVFETASEYFSQADLAQFQSTYSLTSQAAVDIGGFETSSCNNFRNCDEGNLDIQYIMGISQVTVSNYWYVASTSTSNPFVTWITDLASNPKPPQSNSMSWGSIEQQQSTSVLSSFNTEAMKLGAIGVTVTISSGDDGVSNSNCACSNSSGSSVSSWTGAGSWTGQGYFPNFPASCPYVTALGATMGSGGYPPAVGGTELACQSQLGGVITSGGGFSTYYAQPSWQQSTVTAYFNGLTAATTPAAGYNKNGRGIPDMAMLGVYYQVVLGGQLISLFGTSCSSPVTAAMVSLINAARYVQGAGSIGFMNPTLYANPSKFTDVTSGFNNCCAYTGSTPSQATCCQSGFNATAGWDPVTGLGSIQYNEFLSLFPIA